MANEKRLIDANALLEAIDKSDKENFHKGVANRSIHHYEHRHFMNMVLNAPTVDAVEVVHGHMVERIVDYEYPSYKVLDCSECGCSVEKWHNYCPNCGAKMDGERKDNG